MDSSDDVRDRNRRYPHFQERTEIRHSVPKLNESIRKFNSIYKSGKRYNAREWIGIMSELLSNIE
mgnify:CR=1 FL=1|tara:strand:+ start:513 stop:707 length:195 start_codon:yes stop_codon:yes gene_type:complete